VAAVFAVALIGCGNSDKVDTSAGGSAGASGMSGGSADAGPAGKSASEAGAPTAGNGQGGGNAGTPGGAGIMGGGGTTSGAGTTNGAGQGGRETGGATSAGASGQAAPGGQGSGGAQAGGAGRSGAAGSAGIGAGSGGKAGSGGQGGGGGRSISFGTLLDAGAVMSSAAALAESLSNPSAESWRKKGDQHRTYRFAEANADEPYRLYVPTTWDGTSSLPLAMFLHGAGSNENTYVDQNDAQLLSLAEKHGFILVAPLGVDGAYGNFLRLTAPFGDEAGAAELMAQVTADSERTNELSEKDVVNVLELVLHEYPVDRSALFLCGHSMGSGGTWYIGGKYASYFQGIAPMSGPFVQETGYPWEDVRRLSILVTEGTQTPSLDASKLLAGWLTKNGFSSKYEEVNADHGGMVPLVLPDVFDFFDGAQK
jgi:poly(3-hydroxybutyrate) depolymerase